LVLGTVQLSVAAVVLAAAAGAPNDTIAVLALATSALVGSMGRPFLSIALSSIRQLVTPIVVLGRVATAQAQAVALAALMGIGISGVVLEAFGVVPTLILAVVLRITVAASALGIPQVRPEDPDAP
jgi:hypothetical protein